MTRSLFALCAALALAACVDADLDSDVSLRAVAPEDCLAPKVLVCHIPPGNPANAHNICISANAVETHVDHHGDSVGACEPVCAPAGEDCEANADCCSEACNEGTCGAVLPPS